MTSTIQNRFNIVPEEGVKAPVRMATTATITLSGLQTIDGISGAENDRVLVWQQTTASENGIWIMQPTAWVRASDWDDNTDVVSGMLVTSSEGALYGGVVWKGVFAGVFSIDTTEVVFSGAPIVSNTDLRYGPTFATVAAMVAANPVSIDGTVVVLVAGMTVTTQGYYTAGDGSGSDYLVVPSQAADEKGDHTADNGTVLVLQDLETKTIDHYGAKGTGEASNDSASLVAMLAAQAGKARIGNKEYLIGTVVITAYDEVTILGEVQPVPNSGFTLLERGSVLIGEISITANTVQCTKWGLDSGPGRAVVVSDGFVSNAKNGELGIKADVREFCSLGKAESGTTHGALIQGYEHNEIHDIYTGRQQFGVVVKGRNVNVTNVDMDEIRTGGVYPKADTPANAGNVLDATVNHVQISNVKHRAASGNVASSAVYVQASTEAVSSVQVDNVDQTGGLTPLRIQGGGLVSDPTINNIQASQINSDASVEGCLVDGFVQDVQIVNINAVNPTSGKAIIVGANVSGYDVTNVHTLISDAGNLSTVCAELRGVGSWDNFSVRNPARTMSVDSPSASLATITNGQISGDIDIISEVALTGINSAVADTDTPKIRVLPGSLVILEGKFDLTSSTNEFFCNLPINTGKQKIYACGGIDSTSEYQTIAVRLNDFQLSVEPSLPAGWKFIDLSGIVIPMR